MLLINNNSLLARPLNSLSKIITMKRLIALFSLTLLIGFSGFANGQEGKEDHISDSNENDFKYQKVQNKAFKVGEVLKYKFAYGFINAGEATLEVKKAPKQIQGRNILHIVGEGRSISAFDWFFKVRDKYETYIDEEGVFPWLFVRRINEGGYKKAQDYQFFQNKGVVRNEDEEVYKVPHGVQDMLSSFYYARTIDFSNAKKGDIFEFDSFVDEEVFRLKIKYAGTKTIKISEGKFDCMVFHPLVQEGRVFEADEDLTVYITNDENKIPILAKAKIAVGSIRMELTGYENLANPIAKK